MPAAPPPSLSDGRESLRFLFRVFPCYSVANRVVPQGLMITLLRSGEPMASTARWISESGKRWEIASSGLTRPR